MAYSQDTWLYRQDESVSGKLLSAAEREKLLRPYLPSPPSASSQQISRKRSQPLRDLLKSQLYLLVYTLIHFLFSIYIRIRQTQHAIVDRTLAILYYHHRAPELIKQDVKNLSKLPRHLSTIVDLKGQEHGTAGLEGLMDDVAEVSAWCCCVGIPMLSVYERTGM